MHSAKLQADPFDHLQDMYRCTDTDSLIYNAIAPKDIVAPKVIPLPAASLLTVYSTIAGCC